MKFVVYREEKYKIENEADYSRSIPEDKTNAEREM